MGKVNEMYVTMIENCMKEAGLPLVGEEGVRWFQIACEIYDIFKNTRDPEKETANFLKSYAKYEVAS